MGKRTNTARWIEKSQRWQINVQVNGVRKTFSSRKPGRTGQREANAKADAWLDDGIQSTRKNLDKIFLDYLDDLKLRTGKSNWKKVEGNWKNWISPVIGRLKPDSLSDQKLQDVINRAYARGHLSKKSLQNIRMIMVAFCKFLRKSKFSTYHPEEIIIPHAAKVGVRRILQPEHLKTLFSVDTTKYRGKVIQDPYINAYRFQLLTGLRPGELMGLMPGDIVGNRVNLQRSINFYGEITSGKNENAVRGFMLTPMAKAVLDDQLQRMDGLYVFGVKSTNNYGRYWRRYCEANGIPHMSLYELRHTFVSVIQSLPEGWIKALVGHSRSMDTFGVYAHEMTGQPEQIAAGVEDVFQGILKAKEKTVC